MSGRNTNFYYSFLVLPPEKRKAIVAVWDFCRAVDDAVDELPPPTQPCDEGAHEAAACAELAKWRRELAACFGDCEPETAQAIALQPYVSAFDLPRDAFNRVIDGVEMDLRQRRYQTFDDLREYCLRVASAVGHICVAIFGCRDEAARQYATDLGIALQITNIIRDIPTDLSRGRLYLPIEDLGRFRCAEEDLHSGLASPAVRALLAFECVRARSFYEKAEKILASTRRRRLVAARIMGAIYLAILERIERRGYDVFSEVVRVPRSRRAVIAASTWAKTIAGL